MAPSTTNSTAPPFPASTFAPDSFPSSYIIHLQAISASLFFLVPLVTIPLFILALSRSRSDSQLSQQQVFINIPSPAWTNHVKHVFWRRVRVIWSYCAITSLALLAILAGSFGFICGQSNEFALTAAEAVTVSMLQFELGISVIYLLTVSAPCSTSFPSKFCLYSITLGIILFCATLLSLFAPFFHHTIPSFLSPLLTLLYTILTIPILIHFLLATLHVPSSRPLLSLSSPKNYPPLSTFSPLTPPPQEKHHSSLDLVQAPPSTGFNIEARAPTPDPESLHLSARFGMRNLWIFILCAQMTAILSSAFSIGIQVVLPKQSLFDPIPTVLSQTEISAWKEASVFNIAQTAFTVLSTICIMSAFLLHSFSPYPPSPCPLPSSYTTAPPRIHPKKSSTPSQKTKRSCRSLQASIIHPPPSAPPHSAADDFLNLHDPFASPTVGTFTTSASLPVPSPRMPGTNRMSAWGTLTLPPAPQIPSPAPSQLLPSTGIAGLGLRINLTPKSRRQTSPSNARQSKNSSVQALLPSSSSVTGSMTYNMGRARSTSTLPSTCSYSSLPPSGGGEDVDFDVGEALLAQTLLRRLELGVRDPQIQVTQEVGAERGTAGAGERRQGSENDHGQRSEGEYEGEVGIGLGHYSG